MFQKILDQGPSWYKLEDVSALWTVNHQPKQLCSTTCINAIPKRSIAAWKPIPIAKGRKVVCNTQLRSLAMECSSVLNTNPNNSLIELEREEGSCVSHGILTTAPLGMGMGLGESPISTPHHFPIELFQKCC